jgi:hypothetical protein
VSVGEGQQKLTVTLGDDIWDNGQTILVEIAKQEELKLGPNQKMQELMSRRNAEILAYISQNSSNIGVSELDTHIAEINTRYIAQITDAAGSYPDDGGFSEKDEVQLMGFVTIMVIAVSACVCMLSIAVTTWVCCRRKPPQNASSTTLDGEHVVIGSPVQDVAPTGGAVLNGTAVATTPHPEAAAQSTDKSNNKVEVDQL